MTSSARLPASFRDPSGHLYRRDGVLYRQVNRSYVEHYERLMGSGLYADLVQEGLLIPHAEVDVEPLDPASFFNVIRPEPIQFISYPYEWCFSQLKDAALTTLVIQERALEYDMVLKDSSAYNIQFHRGKPVLIDTLSFEIYKEGEPWVAYRQFCQHFLAPLALMVYRDPRLIRMLRVHLDGIPLDLASSLLPWRTRLNLRLLSHIHLHAAAQRRYRDRPVTRETVRRRMSRMAFRGLIDNLKGVVAGLNWKPEGTEWGTYYDAHTYSSEAFAIKRRLVMAFLSQIQPRSVWDFGANIGVFSRLASDEGIPVVAFDNDHAAVERNYLDCKAKGETELLPLVVDLTNPSPGLGWENRERNSLLDRPAPDALLALALIHHLAISNNVPFDGVASFFSSISRWLIIEYVPKHDPQVERMLVTREDIFADYNQEAFERVFSDRYRIVEAEAITGSERRLYLMERR